MAKSVFYERSRRLARDKTARETLARYIIQIYYSDATVHDMKAKMGCSLRRLPQKNQVVLHSQYNSGFYLIDKLRYYTHEENTK